MNDLQTKIDNFQQLITYPQHLDLDVFPSKINHYRMRAEFSVRKIEDNYKYLMFNVNKKPYIVENFIIANTQINALMPKVLQFLNENQIFANKIFAIEFLTSRSENLISCLFHRVLNDADDDFAKKLQDLTKANIILRARKQKKVFGNNFVKEVFNVDNREIEILQAENSFSQPNAEICEKMLNWTANVCKALKNDTQQNDLLELYCGVGNFTFALNQYFDKVLATEVNKQAIDFANRNKKLNKATNVEFARLAADEIISALQKEREFRRLSHLNLNDYQFSTIFVDPPRSGVGIKYCHFLQRFNNILYISCNPKSLKTDLDVLLQTHKIEKIAVFDQFPQTKHLESGVFLSKII